MRTCARRRLTKWTFFVFHFRCRRRCKSLDLVLLVSRGQQTQLHIRLTERQWHCCYNKRLQVSTRAVKIQMEPLKAEKFKTTRTVLSKTIDCIFMGRVIVASVYTFATVSPKKKTTNHRIEFALIHGTS